MEEKRVPPNSLSSDPSPGGRTDFTSTTDPLWTVEEVAGYLKLQPETIRGMARRGELPAIKIGKVWRFRKSAIKDLMIQQS
jgi:excisionase family DNA binding protein